MNQKYTREQLQQMARDAAWQHGLDPALFVAQLAQESGDFDPNVVVGKRKSSAGAIGVAQFMPRTAKAFGIDPKDPAQAIPAAAQYMSQLKQRFGTEELARQAYNWGEGNLSKHLANPAKRPMPQETREYNALIAKRVPGPAAEMQIPVLGQAPRSQVMQLMNAARAPAAAAGSPGLFSEAAPARPAAAPMPPPAPKAQGLFGALEEPAFPDPLGDIFAQATERAGTLFPAQSALPDRFDGMIQQLVRSV